VHIVTEKYTGGELFDKIIENTTRNGCLSEAEAAKIIEQLLKAVSFLHANDIVHRESNQKT
jgi:calcium/calmodulin-dependent protein kinase I